MARLTKPVMEALAAEHGVDLSGASNNDDRLAALVAASAVEGEAPAASPAPSTRSEMRVRAAARRKITADEVQGGEPEHEHKMEQGSLRVRRGGDEFYRLACACGARAVGDRIS